MYHYALRNPLFLDVIKYRRESLEGNKDSIFHKQNKQCAMQSYTKFVRMGFLSSHHASLVFP